MFNIIDAFRMCAYKVFGIEIAHIEVSKDYTGSSVATWTAWEADPAGPEVFFCVMPQSDFFFGGLAYGMGQDKAVDLLMLRTLQFMGKV